jgi:hypothetical protein
LGIGNEHINENTSETKLNIHEIGKDIHQDSNENNGLSYEGKPLSVDEDNEHENNVGRREEDESRRKHGMGNPHDNGGGDPMELSDTKMSRDTDKHEMKIINDDHEEGENEEPIKLSDTGIPKVALNYPTQLMEY